MIVGCSQALPASVDVLSPCILTRRGPESDLMGGHEMTPAGALKMNPPIPGGNRLKERSWRRYSRGFDPGRPPTAASPTRHPTGPRMQPLPRLQQESPWRPAATVV